MGANSYTYRRDAQPPVRRRRAGLRRFQAAAVGISAAGASMVISATTGFAHIIVGTTPVPSSGTVGSTTLTDHANVAYADNTRDVVFMLWAPGDCGKQGATPEFTDIEEITQSGASTVVSNGHIPLHAGIYSWTVEIVVDSSGFIENGPTACADEHVTVAKAQPAIATTPSAGGPVGTTISDTAKVTGGFQPAGTVTFVLFPPGKACSQGNAVYTSPAETLTNGTAQSGSYKTTVVGTYHWAATYSGDANNLPASSGCDQEPVGTTMAQPDIATTASAGGPVGTTISDTAKVTGGVQPTGTVTFALFPPGKDCEQGNAVYTSPAETLTNGTAHSGSYKTTAAGTYHWVATYSGDANNKSVSSGCDEEPVTTGKASPAIATTTSAGGVTGTSISDTATVSGGHNPTGTVMFKLYGPSDATCTGTPVFTSMAVDLKNGSAQSGAFTGTSTVGTYHWIATYSGDANNGSVSSKCSDEPVTITAPQPTGGVGAVTSTPTPGTGADLSLRLAVGLLVIGVGLVTALTTEVIARRLHKRRD